MIRPIVVNIILKKSCSLQTTLLQNSVDNYGADHQQERDVRAANIRQSDASANSSNAEADWTRQGRPSSGSNPGIDPSNDQDLIYLLDKSAPDIRKQALASGMNSGEYQQWLLGVIATAKKHRMDARTVLMQQAKQQNFIPLSTP